MLTRSGWLTALGALACLAAGRVFGVAELFVLGAIALALPLLALVVVRRAAPDLTVDRRIAPATLTVGALGRAEISLTHHGRRPVGLVTVVDEVEGTVGAQLRLGPLRPGAVEQVGYRLPTSRRGLITIGPLRVELTDPFGLARRPIAGAARATAMVLPRIDPIFGLPVGAGRSEPLAGMSHRAVTTNGVEDLATLRPYVVGDDLRRVHWPSSAHADDLLVRRDEQRWQGRTIVLLDSRTGVLDPADFERAVSAAAGIVHGAGTSDDRVRLVLADGTDTGMVDGRRAGGELLEILALARQREVDLRPLASVDDEPGDLAIVLTGGTRHQVAALAAAIDQHGLGRAILVAFGADQEPSPPVDLDAPLATTIDVRPGEPIAEAWDRGRASRS